MGSVQRHYLFSETFMKPKTRDNLIYLVVGLSIAGLLAARIFYAVSHDRVIGMFPLSKFAFRTVTSTLVVGYLVGREVRKVGATLADMVLCVVVAGALQLVISFGFHQYVGQLSSLSYVCLAALEIFFIVSLATWAVSHFRARSGNA